MEITLIIIAFSAAAIIWLCLKIATLLERQNQHNQNVQDLKQQINTIDTTIISNTNRSHELHQQITDRLTKIDTAQNNIEKLSAGVIDLQNILNDKRSRGAFGETQLTNLVTNIIPHHHAKMQHTLGNGKRADCLVILPPPTNSIAIDAKFPLENFKNMAKQQQQDPSYYSYQKLYKKDIKNHIDDIKTKYINPPETAESAIMFIPAEAIFADIHNHHPDIVEYAHKNRVWLASPTTLMAILTTAAGVIKDDLTIKNIDKIKQQLLLLAQDFQRFDQRIQSLFKHVEMCSQDANKVKISAQKISEKFSQIRESES